MMRALRQEMQALLSAAQTARRPALRRSSVPWALLATDLPLLTADWADFAHLAAENGWRVEVQNGWLLLGKTPNPPEMPGTLPDAPGELGCCLSLLSRHQEAGEAGDWLPLLLKAEDTGGQALERYARALHRELAARLRRHETLPGTLLPFLCHAAGNAEERKKEP